MNIIDRILGEARSPEQLRQYANTHFGDIHEKARRAFMYAKDVIKGRWPEGEATILRDPSTSLRYAREIIQGRWPEAESIIATDRGASVAYARDVIKGRWPELEATLGTDPEMAVAYAENVIKGRWPELEAAIEANPRYAERYADSMTAKRVAEDTESDLAKKEIYAQKYLKNFPDRKLSWAMKGWIPFGDTTDVWGI